MSSLQLNKLEFVGVSRIPNRRQQPTSSSSSSTPRTCSYNFKAPLPQSRNFGKIRAQKCGGIRAEFAEDGRESRRWRVVAEECGNGGWNCRQILLNTTMAVALSLSLHQGEFGSSAEAAENLVTAALSLEQLEQPEPSKGSCPTCIGVVDETLGICNSTQNCLSTFDDRPNFFVAPWEYPGKLSDAVRQLKQTVLSMGAEILEEPEERYVHAVFTDKVDGAIDDVEFLFSKPSEDATVVLRAASRAEGVADKDRNKKRLEQIRSSLMWEQVPVLRNRSRALFFLESPWDSFGPEPPPTFDFKESLDFVPE